MVCVLTCEHLALYPGQVQPARIPPPHTHTLTRLTCAPWLRPLLSKQQRQGLLAWVYKDLYLVKNKLQKKKKSWAVRLPKRSHRRLRGPDQMKKKSPRSSAGSCEQTSPH
jgi:hypothetical protein